MIRQAPHAPRASPLALSLQTTGMDKLLIAASAPGYVLPEKPKPKEQLDLAPQFPWWFGFGVVGSGDRAVGGGHPVPMQATYLIPHPLRRSSLPPSSSATHSAPSHH